MFSFFLHPNNVCLITFGSLSSIESLWYGWVLQWLDNFINMQFVYCSSDYTARCNKNVDAFIKVYNIPMQPVQ